MPKLKNVFTWKLTRLEIPLENPKKIGIDTNGKCHSTNNEFI